MTTKYLEILAAETDGKRTIKSRSESRGLHAQSATGFTNPPTRTPGADSLNLRLLIEANRPYELTNQRAGKITS